MLDKPDPHSGWKSKGIRFLPFYRGLPSLGSASLHIVHTRRHHVNKSHHVCANAIVTRRFPAVSARDGGIFAFLARRMKHTRSSASNELYSPHSETMVAWCYCPRPHNFRALLKYDEDQIRGK